MPLFRSGTYSAASCVRKQKNKDRSIASLPKCPWLRLGMISKLNVQCSETREPAFSCIPAPFCEKLAATPYPTTWIDALLINGQSISNHVHATWEGAVKDGYFLAMYQPRNMPRQRCLRRSCPCILKDTRRNFLTPSWRQLVYASRGLISGALHVSEKPSIPPRF